MSLSHVCSLESEQQLDALIIRLCGEFDLASEERFKQETERLLHNRTGPVVLDLRELAFMDSTASCRSWIPREPA